ncbi:beta strand repeat-containing protein [Salarchaeum japonicum]|uniref:beta strand repeat-containing protein n=1 Tax=Salarchaeum japonicum TaxID=555573 RepID=UPI003C75FA88
MTSGNYRGRALALLAGALVILAAASALPGAAAAADSTNPVTIHVDDDWSDNTTEDLVGDGYELGTNATATISDALALADDHDTIVVHNGTYSPFTVTENVTVRAADGATATVSGGSDALIQLEGASDGATLHRFTLAGEGATLGVEVRADNITITGNTITGVTTGIQVQDDANTDASATDALIENNTIEPSQVGVSLTGGTHTVTENTITGFTMEGIGAVGATHDFSGNDEISGDGPAVQLYGSVENEVAAANDYLGLDTVDTVAVNANGHVYDASIVADDTTYATLQQAVSNAPAESTVTITESGTYAGFLLNTNLTVTAAPGVDATVSASDGLGRAGERVVDVRADGATVSNLTVDATHASDTYLTGVSVSGENTTVRNVEVLGDADVTGIQTTSASANVSIVDNTVTDANVGISLQGGADTARDNTITGALTEGFGLLGDEHSVAPATVTTADDAPAVRYYGSVSDDVATANAALDSAAVDSVAFYDSGHVYDGAITVGDTAYATIDQAVTNAEDATVEVASGTYDHVTLDVENVTLRATGDATLSEGVTLAADGTDVINFTIESANFHGVSQQVGVYVPVDSGDHRIADNVIVESTDKTSRGVLFAESATGDTMIVDNEISEFTTGVYLSTAENVTVENNDIQHNAAGVGGLEGANVTVTENTFANNTEGVGIGTVTDLSLTENTFRDNDRHVKDWTAPYESLDVLYENNTFDKAVYATGGQTIATDVSTALSEAGNGATVSVSAGTYTVDERLQIPADGVTVEGAAESSVVLDASGQGWPVYAHNVDDVTLRNLTIQGTTQSGSDDTVKAAFVEGLTIEHVTVSESSGNEFDLNNVVNATLHDVTANGDDTAGVGIALSAVENVTLDDVDTAGNAWGGVGIYDLNPEVDAPEGWDLRTNPTDITVTASSDLSEPTSLYADMEYDGTLGTLTAPEYDYAVQNPDHRDRGGDFTFFLKNEADAIDYVRNLANSDSSTVQTLTRTEDGLALGSTFVVADGMSIQTAVDAADAGDTVRVGPGTYTESVHIESELTLIGAGDNDTTVTSPTSIPETFTRGSAASHAVVLVENASADISRLTVDGARTGDTNHEFYGVAYVNASGTVDDVTVTNVTDTEFSGVQHGIAVGAFNLDGEDRKFTLSNSRIVNYQKGGVVASGEGLTARVLDTSVIGHGPTDVTGQNGVQMSGGAQGVIVNNTITGHAYTGEDWSASSVLLYGHSSAAETVVENNTITDSQIAIGVAASTNVSITDNDFANNTWHVGDYTGSLDTTDIYEANDYDAAAYVGTDRDTNGASIFGTLPDAVSSAESSETVFATGTFTESVQFAADNVTLQGEDATLTASVGFENEMYPEDVTVSGFTFTTDGVAINANDAGDDLTIENNEFVGVENALIHGGEDGGKADLKSGWTIAENEVTNTGDAFRLWNLQDLTVTDNTVENASGSAFSLIAVDDATVTENAVENTTKSGVYVDGPFMDAFDTSTNNVVVENNTFDAAGDTDTEYVQAAVNVGANLEDLDELTVTNNAFLNTTTDAIRVDPATEASGSLDATLNWFGSEDGPASGDISGPVTYDPFLTAPPSEQPADLSESQQFGNDVVIPADGQLHTIAFPADLEGTFGDVFGEFNGSVWAYDAANSTWVRPDASQSVHALDAVVVNATERATISMDYADTKTGELSTPSTTDLHEGWNLVGAPQSGNANAAFGASSADLGRIMTAFEPASSLPTESGTDFTSYTFGGIVAPDVNAHTGYWVYVNEDGDLAAAMPAGTTVEEYALHNAYLSERGDIPFLPPRVVN